MFPFPDTATLRLCSLLASAAYGAIFLALWAKRREQGWMLAWATSSWLYALALFGFQLGRSGLSAALLTTVIGISDLLLIVGVRRFDARRGFSPWMAWMSGATLIALLAPVLTPGLAPATRMMAGTILASLALGASMTVSGIAILRSGDGEAAFGRRVAGIALLAYVPGYVISIAAELGGMRYDNPLAIFPVLSDQLLLGALNMALLAMPWERAMRTLRDATLRDPLTGVFNRTALKQRQVALAAMRPSVFLIDVDHFKSINDRHGHAAGDAVLLAFCREVDALAGEWGGLFVRLGGDEFALVVPTESDHAARRHAETVRARATAPRPGLPQFTISIGMARVAADEDTLSPALSRADQSLYRAKHAGRDRVAA